ncbi:MAG: helix-turn-helix transcriptional regulator [Bdellovibrionaceae bacterium]|nr:helix-turn-helix transcriptional regulator [Pseudobdellovibrionaceae bacterium]
MSEKIGAMVREARLKKDMTQGQVAQLLGFQNAQFVYMIERNIAKVPLDVVGKLIVLLDLNESVIMDLLFSEFRDKAVREVKEGKKAVSAKKRR